MTRTFIELPVFRARWKALGLDDDDLLRLQNELKQLMGILKRQLEDK